MRRRIALYVLLITFSLSISCLLLAQMGTPPRSYPTPSLKNKTTYKLSVASTIIKPIQWATTRTPVVDWTSLSGIDYYYVAIYDSNWNLVVNDWPTTNEWQVPDGKLVDGATYYLYVWGHYPDGMWSEPASTTFTVVEVPYYSQTDFAGDDVWNPWSLTHCAVACHAMLYHWMDKAGIVAGHPTISDYDSATTQWWPGGSLYDVNWGEVIKDSDDDNQQHLAPGLAHVYGRVMTFETKNLNDFNGDYEALYDALIDALRTTHKPIAVGVKGYFNFHEIVAVDYRESDKAIYVYDPDPYSGLAHWTLSTKFWVSKDEIINGWKDLGWGDFSIPTGDMVAKSEWFESTDTPVAIPDYDGSPGVAGAWLWVDSSMSKVERAFVRIDITHTYIGDLYVYVWYYDSDGWHLVTTAWARQGGSADNLMLAIDISAYGDVLLTGHWWYVQVYDYAAGDTGTIDLFAIMVNGT